MTDGRQQDIVDADPVGVDADETALEDVQSTPPAPEAVTEAVPEAVTGAEPEPEPTSTPTEVAEADAAPSAEHPGAPEVEEPAEPTDAAEQAAPTAPAEPAVESVETTAPGEFAEPTATAEPAEPTAAAEPTDVAEPAAESSPSEPAEPTADAEPAESAMPAEPTADAEPVGPAATAETAETAAPAVPVEAAGPAVPAAEPLARSGPTESAEPFVAVEPTESAEPSVAVEPIEPTRSADVPVAEPDHSAPVTAEPTQPVDPSPVPTVTVAHESPVPPAVAPAAPEVSPASVASAEAPTSADAVSTTAVEPATASTVPEVHPTPAGERAFQPAIDDQWKPRPWEPAEDLSSPSPAGTPPAPPTALAAGAAAAAAVPLRVSARSLQDTAPVAPAPGLPEAPPSSVMPPPSPTAEVPPAAPSPALSAPTPVPLVPVPPAPVPAPSVEHPTERLPQVVPVAEADGGGGQPVRPGSPMDVFPDEPTRRHWPRVLAVVATIVVVLAGAYVGALWLWSDRVPPGATVAGVEIGGLQDAEAVNLVEDSLAAAMTEPIPVAAGETRTTLDPVAAGLTLDADATVASVTGFGLEPVRLWHHVFGVGVVEPVTEVDQAALATAVEDVAAALAIAPVDGTIVFVDGQAQTTDAVDGAAIDPDAARDVVVDGWLTAPRPLELPTEVAPPAITQDEVERALSEVARPLVSAPIVVAVADQLAELPTGVLADAASFTAEDDELVLSLDGAMLVEAVTARTTNLLTLPSDATFAFESGSPVVVPGTPGTTLDPDAIAAAVAEAGSASDRTARVDLVESAPTESTEELQALGITQIVSEFSTPLNSEPRRTGNIVNGAAQISGTLVRPGETFSLTEALGPIDAAHGFVQAGAIVNGEHTDAWGGGLSQVSTTTYNAAYLAGFEDVEHHPHSEWFSRYPEGREATIFTGSLDMQWLNNTPYGALVQAWVEGGRVYVRIWGTPYWTVESSTSGRSNVVSPTTVHSQSPTCESQSAGNSGFTVTVTRRLLLEGVEQQKQSWTVRYKPQNAIICGAPPVAPVP